MEMNRDVRASDSLNDDEIYNPKMNVSLNKQYTTWNSLQQTINFCNFSTDETSEKSFFLFCFALAAATICEISQTIIYVTDRELSWNVSETRTKFHIRKTETREGLAHEVNEI